MPTLTNEQGWPRGINNSVRETAVPDGFLRELVNCNLGVAGNPSRREGRTLVLALDDPHSLTNKAGITLASDGGTLYQLDLLAATPSKTALVTGMSPTAYVSYDEHNGDVYYTNGIQSGRINSEGAFPWGTPNPAGQPTVSALTVGGLDAGMYMVAITFQGDYGESGAEMPAVATVAQGGGIGLANIPQPANGENINIYLSDPDGEVDGMRKHVTLADGTTSIGLGRTNDVGDPIDTLLLSEIPAGQIVRSFKGRLWVANEKTLWYTEAGRPGLCSMAHNFFSFSERITVVEPVVDGIFVVAGKTFFLAGTDPKAMSQFMAYPYGAVEWSSMTVPAKAVNMDEVPGNVAYWFSEKGAVLGMPGGQIRAYMDRTVTVPKYTQGASIFRELEGFSQFITAVAGRNGGSAMGVGDSATTEVYRNGVLIP